MARSQRHAVYIKGVDAAGKGVAEGVAAPVYVQQFNASQALTVPVGPTSGSPLKGSSLAGYPPTALPAPKDVMGRTAVGGELTDPGQLNLSGNPHYISFPPAGEASPLPPDADAPTLTSLDPNTAVLGSEDFTLRCLGTNFTEESVIVFAGQFEPIVFVSAEEITTIVKPSLGWGVVTVPVSVQNPGPQMTPSLDFTFTEAAPEADTEARTEKRRPSGKRVK
jgi:hypothetical protein